MLFFPRQGQTCHAYCTYCFRWAQFVDEPDLKMASDNVGSLLAYLRAHPEVWAAGGIPHAVFPTTYEELLRLTGGRSAEVA